MTTRDLSLDRLARRLDVVRRQLQRLAGQRRHLAGHADQRQAAGHVRQHVELQDDVAHEIGQRHADRGVVFEEDDALVFLVDAELEGRTDHRIARHAADLASASAPTASSASAWPSKRTEPARARTTFWPASPTLRFGAPVTSFLVRPCAVVDGRQLEPVGVGMFLDARAPRRRRSCRGPRPGRLLGLDAQPFRRRQRREAHAGDFQAGQRQPLDQLGDGQGERRRIRAASSAGLSWCVSSRCLAGASATVGPSLRFRLEASAMLKTAAGTADRSPRTGGCRRCAYFSMAMRSGPMPKAKPLNFSGS